MENYIVIYAIIPKHIYETKLLTPEEKMKLNKSIMFDKESVKVKKNTFDSMNKVINLN